MTETEACIRLAIDAAQDAEAANPWFNADLDLWLADMRRAGWAALALCRELRDIDELEAALP